VLDGSKLFGSKERSGMDYEGYACFCGEAREERTSSKGNGYKAWACFWDCVEKVTSHIRFWVS